MEKSQQSKNIFSDSKLARDFSTAVSIFSWSLAVGTVVPFLGGFLGAVAGRQFAGDALPAPATPDRFTLRRGLAFTFATVAGTFISLMAFQSLHGISPATAESPEPAPVVTKADSSNTANPHHVRK